MSRTVLLGSFLFLASQIFQLVQLFEDAAARSAANQAPPEDFTVAGIVSRALMIALLLSCCLLLNRHQKGRLRMGRARLCLLVSALLSVWSGIKIVNTVLEIAVYPEFILILDCLTIGVCVLAPIVMLVLADFNGLSPDDNILLFLGIGGIGFTVVSLLIIGVVLRASYTLWRLVPELLFRVGLGLFGLATLKKALRIRASYPLVTPVEEARETPSHQQKKRRSDDEPFSLQLEGEEGDARSYTSRTPRPETGYDDARSYTARTPRPETGYGDARSYTSRTPRPETGYGDARSYTSRTPRPETGYDDARSYTARTPRPEAGYGDARSYTSRTPRPETGYDDARSHTARTPRPQSDSSMWQTGRIIVQGGTGRIPTQDPGTVPAERQTCPYCGKRMPLDFPYCPHCGHSV